MLLRLTVAASVMAAPVSAAELPKATMKLLAELGLQPDILTGLDAELAVPETWIENARQEGVFRLGATWNPPMYRKMTEPFVERYPFLKHEYNNGNRQERTIKPLMAYQAGRSTVDVIVGMGATFGMFKEAGALVDLRVVPAWDKVLAGMKGDDGLWVGQRVAYWCLAYNTDKVKTSDLPRTWDDILTNPSWRDGKIAITNRPNLWFASLWSLEGHGATWGTDFATRLFHEVKPQLRKEGNNALLSLLTAGEFAATIPASPSRIRQYQQKSAPIAWHCPEPVPLSFSEIGILNNNPHPFASLLWLNWFLSKEGQIAQFGAEKSPPIHKELQIEAFLPFPEQIVGKKTAVRGHEELERDLPAVFAVWNPLWDQAAQKQNAR